MLGPNCFLTGNAQAAMQDVYDPDNLDGEKPRLNARGAWGSACMAAPLRMSQELAPCHV